MNIIALPTSAFWAQYSESAPLLTPASDVDKEGMRRRISSLQQALVQCLSHYWQEGTDFEVSWDYDYRFHVCGGIYTEAPVCAEYLSQVQAALLTDSDYRTWTYHTAVETATTRGQFFIKGETVYYPDDGPDFTKLLSRTKNDTMSPGRMGACRKGSGGHS
jgi:hypothetical protein